MTAKYLKARFKTMKNSDESLRQFARRIAETPTYPDKQLLISAWDWLDRKDLPHKG